jgi:hypothetical protein
MLSKRHVTIRTGEAGHPILAEPSRGASPGWPRWNRLLQDASGFIATAEDEMQTYFDDRTEAWQETERAETFQELLNSLTELRQLVNNRLDECPKR